MRKLGLSIAVAVGILSAGSLTNRADAMMLGGSDGIRAAIDSLNVTKNVQFFWGGRRYCWYDDGWSGAGWYWCGYAFNRGYGWGGGYGWHGWRGGRGGGGIIRGGRAGGGVAIRGGRAGGGVAVRGGRAGGGAAVRSGGSRSGGGANRGSRRSDIQLKHDVVHLGQLDNGLGFYRFSYNGSDKVYVGVIAQEVQTVMPEAVVRGKDGYLRVYYDRLGLHLQTWEQWVNSGEKIPVTAASARH